MRRRSTPRASGRPQRPPPAVRRSSMTQEEAETIAAPPGERYFYGTGRRKCAVARVRLYPGTGTIVINGKSFQDMFTRPIHPFDESLRPALRKAGLLTRDPRVKERKKPGLKRARKAPQHTKR